MIDFSKRPPPPGCVAEIGNLDVIVKDDAGVILQGTEAERLQWHEVEHLHTVLGAELKKRELAKGTPVAEPGVNLPEEGWTTDPSPGVYYIRHVLPDGTKTQPAICLITPTGPLPEYACWATTPNLGIGTPDHPSWMNYFTDPGETTTEYLPYEQEITVRDDDGKCSIRKVVFEIFPKVL